MAIGVICAIPQELAHLRASLEHSHTVLCAGLRLDHGRLEGREVVLAETGLGKVNAALVTTLLLDRFGAESVVFSGVAGGLDPELHIGDVVVAERAVQHDFGVVEAGELQTYQAGHVPFFNPTERLGFEPEPALLARVRAHLEGLELPALSRKAGGEGRRPRIVLGTVVTGDQFVHDEAMRERLHARFGAQAVEMEGAAMAQVAERFARPWLLIRALSDLAGKDSRFDFATFVDEVAASSALILRRLLPVF